MKAHGVSFVPLMSCGPKFRMNKTECVPETESSSGVMAVGPCCS